MTTLCGNVIDDILERGFSLRSEILSFEKGYDIVLEKGVISAVDFDGVRKEMIGEGFKLNKIGSNGPWVMLRFRKQKEVAEKDE